MANTARVAIVTDSTADLPADVRERHGITMVPLNVHLGDRTWRDQVELTTPEFMELLALHEEFPTTSQPSAGVFDNRAVIPYSYAGGAYLSGGMVRNDPAAPCYWGSATNSDENFLADFSNGGFTQFNVGPAEGFICVTGACYCDDGVCDP